MDLDTFELDAMSATLARTLQKRLVLWVFRWIIGFGTVAAVTHFWPSVSWLWWAAAVVASLSLVTLLVMHFVVRRRVQAVQAKAAELNLFEEQSSDIAPTRSLEMRPHHGLDTLLLGMDRATLRKVAEAMGFPLSHTSGDSDYFGRSEIGVEFCDDTAMFISVNAHASFAVMFNGFDVFDTSADQVFASIAKNEQNSHIYASEEYVFPDQVVALWDAATQYDNRSAEGRVIWGQIAIGDTRYLKFCQELRDIKI